MTFYLPDLKPQLRTVIGGILILFSISAHSTIADEQWGDWYGSTGMAWDLSSNNAQGETLMFACHGGAFHIRMTTPEYRNDLMADDTISPVTILINQSSYETERSNVSHGDNYQLLFEQLKKTTQNDTLQWVSSPLTSALFSANGLAEAMADTDYQDCIEHP
ncbi:hypothetical protein [Providencia sp.]|uniref:hypothetical protein n=1 Tax=Providencia sp. TaxID=589 RepID=UPI003F9D0FF4